ncbi:MAG: hypothetical protein HXY27_04975 [Hydrogenophilaceae bacterium]|nr:hypothetical protein [Hydrogenophilaceae bacterium]
MKFPVFLLGFVLILAAHAHEGHDHGDEAKPVAVASIAPRFEARSDLFELVGILNGKEWWLYLDKADSNAPVEEAVIEVESGAFKGQAFASEGVFKLVAPSLALPGQHALTITIETEEETDLLTATVELKAADSADAKEIRPSKWLAYVAVAILLALLIVAVISMRKRT